MPGKFEKESAKPNPMLDLNWQHIDQIRNYFIAASDEEMSSLQNSIAPMFLKGFLNDLKSLFILEPHNESKLVSIAKSMGASKHIESLKEIQRQFYSQLAEIYLTGHTNSDIEKLLKVNNQSFLEEVNYQKELSGAFILNERENLKKTFQDNEIASEISDEEMVLAFTRIERERIKNLFKTIQETERKAEQERERSESSMAPDLSKPHFEFDKSKLQWPNVSIKKNNWKRLFIAASVIGLITTTTFIIFNQNKNQNNVALNKPKATQPNVDTNTLAKNPASNFSITSPFPSYEKKIKILKESSFGFAQKDEYLVVETNYLGSYLKDLKYSLEGKTDAKYNDIVDSVKGLIDSLNNIVNKYSFRRNLLKIYVFKKQAVKVFKIENKFYFQIGDTVYECEKSEDLLPLKKVTDKQTLETIDKILFNESK